MRDEDSYQPGEIAIYCEDGAKERVLILINRSDCDWIKYDFEVREVLQESGSIRPNTIGDRVTVFKLRTRDSKWWSLCDDRKNVPTRI